VARLDGSVRHLQEREDIISKFNRNKEYSVFLLTTGVGGVGLTLTAADRVVICEFCISSSFCSISSYSCFGSFCY
jgi:SNF2 family DNA or RNA helicase